MSYQIEQYLEGRWWRIGGIFSTYEEASNKVMQYMEQGQQYGKPGVPLKQPKFRIVRK